MIIKSFKKYFKYLIAISLVLIPGFLIINQPDLGTGFMLMLLGFAIIF